MVDARFALQRKGGSQVEVAIAVIVAPFEIIRKERDRAIDIDGYRGRKMSLRIVQEEFDRVRELAENQVRVAIIVRVGHRDSGRRFRTEAFARRQKDTGAIVAEDAHRAT